ncbi:hypothetical protein NP493_162g02032 [Ridgeia piscesae]|uniref:RING-type E3 ubiquitin transferase n=1 Tax=Ridgeia piscesae TaxID=27915 RepID=A0AAD9UFK3_RIDPI|nr:hypothetical protein NP493_162g02032 [Ridgeia piscesae]
MGEGVPWSSKILCRYYIHGVCREGESCRFSHEGTERQDMVCKFYLKGNCSYGANCRYDHTRPKKTDRPSGSTNMPTASTSSNAHSSRQDKVTAKTRTTTKGVKPVVLPKDSTASHGSRMVTLKKNGYSSDSGLGDEPGFPMVKDPEQWVKATEFVPGQLWQGSAPTSYSQAAQSGVEPTDGSTLAMPEGGEDCEMCPYAAHGLCRYGDNCVYMHGDICEMCGRAVLHPTHAEQRTKHMQECVAAHEEDMVLSFAVAHSQDKTCGVCMENVLEKCPPTERRFGILSNCNHVFCLSCIRKWRSAKQFEHKIVKSCPECRVKSDFVTPSKYWVDEKEDKLKLIESYKKAMSTKPCKYFDQGRGECPFNAHCFYLHAYPDGRKASPRPVRRRRRQDDSGELRSHRTHCPVGFL